jgi:SAM-dependent methyltransferase
MFMKKDKPVNRHARGAKKNEAGESMGWVRKHYTEQSKLVGKAKIQDFHRELAKNLHSWCEELSECRRVLELGAGACGLAAAMAEYGYEVFAVEFNQADIELARSLVKQHRIDNLHIIDGDFYEVNFDQKFDFIYYWDGFGVGEDSDQRRLLTRIGREWLTDDGIAIIDVFSPWNWQRDSGKVSTFKGNDGKEWTREIQFDPINSRFRDFKSPKEDTGVLLSQTIRLYSLQEFLLLTEGTGTEVEAFYANFGKPISLGESNRELSDELLNSNGYFARLVKSL